MKNTLSAKDNELIEIAKKHVKEMYKEGRTSIAAALRTKKGTTYTGINLKYRVRGVSMCAARIALFKAFDAGDTELDTMVEVKYFPERDVYEIVSTCGECRQLEIHHAPLLTIIVIDGSLKKVPIEELLPYSFV